MEHASLEKTKKQKKKKGGGKGRRGKKNNCFGVQIFGRDTSHNEPRQQRKKKEKGRQKVLEGRILGNQLQHRGAHSSQTTERLPNRPEKKCLRGKDLKGRGRERYS